MNQHAKQDDRSLIPHLKPVVSRFAPTPSGRMHLGNVYALLAAWLSARAVGGRVLLRIEDLDPRGQDRRISAQLMGDLQWLGLEWDGPVVYQSERTELYRQAFAHIADLGLVYPCFCSRAALHAASAPHASDGNVIYPGTCRNLTSSERSTLAAHKEPSYRVRVPEFSDPRGRVCFHDLVCGEVCETLAESCGDFVLQRADGVFAYQLAVVVDDADMGVTQVVRGNDLLSSVARQCYLQDLLELPHPTYAHVPLIVATDGRRLSKRDKDIDLGALRTQGICPQHILSVLGYWMGINPDCEELTLDALIGRFNWEDVAQAGRTITCDIARIFG